MAAVFTVPEAALPAPERSRPAKQGMLARIVAAFIRARQEQADRQVAEILGRHGGLMAPEGSGPLSL